MNIISPQVIDEHGLSSDEYDRILAILGREPNLTELGIFSVMWSEHCSYKSSKFWLRKLPTKAPWVICGPGENAGVIDIGDGKACIFKMESHNHPSFIEPYQGAATGVGGILRDVFTMGARPVANINALRFGEPAHPKTRHLVNGVVAGIGAYGNCIGIPTVGGEVNFDPSYNGNILVNAMTVGIADVDKIFYSAAAGVGNAVVYVGSKTGRDGIHGATMASAEFDENLGEKRPTVQVGDPFTEKLLLEACLELMATDAIVAIQDMGAAGLTSSSVEMSDKGGVGIEFDLDRVPVREEAMTPYEIMLSESQERMLMILKPGHEEMARGIFEKWELDFAIIGTVTDTNRLILKSRGDVVCDIPVPPLVAEAPEYERAWTRTPLSPVLAASDALTEIDVSPAHILLEMIASPNLCSRQWVWEQYDHMVMGDTVQRPGGDSAVVRIHGTDRGLAISADCTPRYCVADPVEGGRQAVAEVWRNLTASGATPLAITDNMNFGNPERPEIMGQFVACIEGMSDACKALDFPVVSGNVSLYNETNGTGILPTPAIGGVGLINNVSEKMVVPAFQSAGDDILLFGKTDGHLGRSLFLHQIGKGYIGAPPPVDLFAERRNGDFVRSQIDKGLVTACHDLSDGGLLIAVAEMALAGNWVPNLAPHRRVYPNWPGGFGEDQARYLVTTKLSHEVIAAAETVGVPYQRIGRTGGIVLTLADGDFISLSALKDSSRKLVSRIHGHWPG